MEKQNIIQVNVEKDTTKKLLQLVRQTFDKHHRQLKERSLLDQRVIGDILTVIESEIKNEMKDAAKNGFFECDLKLVWGLSQEEIDQVNEDIKSKG